MVDGELIGWELLPTVLAHVVITLEKIPPAERDARVWNPIEFPQRDNLRNFQAERDALDEALTISGGQLGPVRPTVRAEVFWVYDESCPLIHHDQCPSNRRHVDRLPIPVEDQRGPLKYTTRHGGTCKPAALFGDRKWF